MTRKERILLLLKKPGRKMTCQEITKYFIKKDKLEGNVAIYLSGSISSILRKMVDDQLLMYDEHAKGPRGGHVYKIYQNKSKNY